MSASDMFRSLHLNDRLACAPTWMFSCVFVFWASLVCTLYILNDCEAVFISNGGGCCINAALHVWCYGCNWCFHSGNGFWFMFLFCYVIGNTNLMSYSQLKTKLSLDNQSCQLVPFVHTLMKIKQEYGCTNMRSKI